MPRYRLTIEYDGGPYNGFQSQAGLPTVQGSLERAITSFCGPNSGVTAAGRTDAGVHALAQVIHFDVEKTWPPDVVRNAINAHLVPEPIAVLAADEAAAGFHARFSATTRRYVYRILNRPGPPALDTGRVWHIKKPLDVEAMRLGAKHLVGHHDFTTFRDAECQAKSPMKTLDEVLIIGADERVEMQFASRSFLHRQVRSMVGTLVEVGAGRWRPEDVAGALDARDRRACGPVAPAQALYLLDVAY